MTNAIDSAISGLRIAQQALTVASNNIANASTPGYTRKTLPQQNMLIAGQSVGAEALPLSRVVNRALITDVNRQTALTEGYNVTAKYLNRIQDFQGPPNAGRALSSQVTNLANIFTQLSSTPDNLTLLSQTVNVAQQTANRINDFSKMLTTMRNDAEADISTAIADINQSLDSIARLNVQITSYAGQGQSTADLEDQRDLAIKNVAKYIDITTFPTDSTINVITKQGEMLADATPHLLYFQRSNILPSSYYPGGGVTGITVDSPTGNDVTTTGLGGQLGALLDLRDETLPQYMAQLDEFSYQLANRFQNEGLKLFTDVNGTVPPAAPNVSPPLGYVGFSSIIQVNSAVVLDPNLIRNGTTGGVQLPGSNEVIRRVAQFAFGSFQYQQASGTTPILGIGALTANLPLVTRASVVGTVNIAAYAPDLSAVPGLTTPTTFTLSIGGVPQTINIGAADTAANLVTTINGFFPGAASINSLGQLAIAANATIIISDGPVGPPAPVGAGGIAALGLSFATTLQPQPSFQVQVGTQAPVTISIAPADTSVQLLLKLNAVPGLQAVLNGANGLLLTPLNGGDIQLTDGLGTPLTIMGVTTSNIAHSTFQQNNLGPNSNLSTGLLANSSLQDYMSNLVSIQGEDNNTVVRGQQQEDSFLKTLNARNDNLCGVNIDQEMSDLIRIQSAYAAAAKMITASQKLFEDMLNAFRT